VLNTPLFTDVVANKYVWKVEKDGMYSVRSVCRLCVSDLIDTIEFCVPGRWNQPYLEASGSSQNQESHVEKWS
jgi:hypothetical protein